MSQPINPNPPNKEPNQQTGKYLWPAVVIVLLITTFFRFYRIGDHPLGIFFDPAINGLDSLRLMQRGGHVLFFPTNGGRESLFMYLLIPFIGLFGSTPFAIRALTATISLLNVALLFAFLHDLRFTIYDLRVFRSQFTIHNYSPRNEVERDSQFTIMLPALASLTLATMYWHISVSRLGQRPILVPMLSIPIFWLFLKGWTNGQTRWFIFSGALMGLAVGYTYGAARLLPVILVLAVLPEFLGRGQGSGVKNQVASSRGAEEQSGRVNNSQLQSPKRSGEGFTIRNSQFKNLLILIATALITYLPMALYFATHPAQFSARAGSVMVWNFLDTPVAIASELGRNALRVAGFFCCAGNPNPIFGLPGYPGLSWLLAPFLLIGLFVTLKNWRNLFYRLIALWWFIGVAPSIIAIEAPHPLRMIVAIPPTTILVALGLLFAFGWLYNRIFASHNTQHATRFLFYALPFLLILLPLPGLYNAYFNQWTARQATRGAYDYGAIAIRDALLENAQTGIPIYLPLSRLNDSTLLYYLGGSFEREARIAVERGPSALVISPDKNATDTTWARLHNGVITVLPPLTIEGQLAIQSALSGPNAQPVPMPQSHEIAARLAPTPIDPATFTQPLITPLEAAFGPLQLIGTTHPFEIMPQTPVTFFWQVDQPLSDEYEILVRLVDDNRRAYGNDDARPTDWVYPTSFWRPGLDTVAAQHVITFQADPPPPGRYWLAVSAFNPATGQLLPLTAGTSDSPDTFYIGPLRVPQHQPLPDAAHHLTPQVANFGDTIHLLGYNLEPQSVAPGQSTQVQLLWQAKTAPDTDYTVFIHLLDENNNLVTGSDTQPLNGTYPTSIWTGNEQVFDPHTLTLPNNLSPGQYRLAIGLYHQPNGQRLPLITGNGQPDLQELILGQTITVQTPQ